MDEEYDNLGSAGCKYVTGVWILRATRMASEYVSLKASLSASILIICAYVAFARELHVTPSQSALTVAFLNGLCLVMS